MKAYKFLNSCDVPKVMEDNTIKVGGLDYFRKLEGPLWVADPSEGSIIASSGAAHYPGRVPEHMARRYENMGMYFGDSIDVHVVDNGYRDRIDDLYIFCASLDPFESARKAMCEDAPPDYRYDSCIMIHDVRSFFDHILATGRVKNGDQYVPVTQFFKGSQIGRAEYMKRDVFEATREQIPINNPYLKPHELHPQQEVRMVFARQQHGVEDFFIVKMDDPRQHLELLF
ncbi:hypothetical protein [Sinorhizobium meliloti]|uniref:hypothetical protein n=1 Tax=Rhizobium meliloti TaxID=382 RepID=UPI000FDAF2E7|nr:hypothetical protein [Sinorhizobium meliloti]RVL04765.1 hypothetical protein CN152_04360 [Sinorhizobium meliloti]RVN50604.1 hypothetical protein CN113_04725 [Sinorhizobium meliloti]